MKTVGEAKVLVRDAKAHLFDFDGTVANLDNLHVDIFGNIFRDGFGLEFTRHDFMKYISGRGSEDGIREYLEINGINEFDEVKINDMFTSIKRDTLEGSMMNDIYLLPGIEKFLESNRTRTSVIVTSSKKEYVEKILSYFEIYGYFEKVFDRDSITNGKPHPDVFLKAVEYTGFNINECIAFEDSLFGLRSAKSANLFTVGILNPGWNDEFVYDLADIVVEDYRELL